MASKRNLRRKACDTKVTHLTEKAAERAVEGILSKLRAEGVIHRYDGDPVRIGDSDEYMTAPLTDAEAALIDSLTTKETT